MFGRSFDFIGIRCQPNRGSEYGQSALGYDNIRLPGAVETVNHHIGHTAIDGDHHTRAGLQGQFDTGHAANLPGPGSGRIYKHISLYIIFTVVRMIKNPDSRHRPMRFMKSGDF